MTQKGRSAQRSHAHRLISRYSTLLASLVFGAIVVTTVAVSAADSDLDPSFDGDGIVTTDHDEFEQINDIAIQPDGKIVAAGHSGILHDTVQEPLSMMAARYNADGSLDATFGNGGIVTTAIGTYAKAWAVAIQADGKIVLGGRSGTLFQSDFTLVRYNPNGSLDSSFGTGGIVITSFSGFAQIEDVAIQADGKIVVTGDAPGPSVSLTIFTVARYNTNGSLDPTLDGDGVSQAVPMGLSLSPAIVPQALALQADQKIAVAGFCFDSSLKFCVSRYNPNGSLDNTFDSDGLVTTDFDSAAGAFANDLSIQPDNKIVAAGLSFGPSGNVPVLARYNPNGSPDTSFDVDGRVTMPNSVQFEPAALALQADGKMVIAGRDFLFSGSAMAVARFNSDGSLDDTFGTDGIVTTPVGTVHSAASAVAIQTDGRIVAGGYGNFTSAPEATLSDFALVRYGVGGGSVSGGGWFDSPQGAFVQMPAASGKASFGFIARHQSGATVPVGNTRFQLNAGDLNFQSTSYDSLVISGNKALCTGTGTINGSGSYRFKLTTIDGGDNQDKIRLRIWSDSAGLIYDNEPNTPESADPTTVLGGGAIVIHH